MDKLDFHICWYRPGARWLVRIGDEILGNYFRKNEAVATAIAAASEARSAGRDAEVWSEATGERVF